jgi:hypothetical protein
LAIWKPAPTSAFDLYEMERGVRLTMKPVFLLVLLGTILALSTSAAPAWWQFVANGPNSKRQASPHYGSEKACEAALRATERLMAKKFPDRYPLVGSCEEYREAR